MCMIELLVDYPRLKKDGGLVLVADLTGVLLSSAMCRNNSPHVSRLLLCAMAVQPGFSQCDNTESNW